MLKGEPRITLTLAACDLELSETLRDHLFFNCPLLYDLITA